MSASNTSADADISSTIRVTDTQSEMPRTRSALPIRSSGPVPVGCAAAYASDMYGLAHTCTGCTRPGSPAFSRSTTSVPSSNSAYPWHVIGVATSLRITL
jgi:hypothetical protein